MYRQILGSMQMLFVAPLRLYAWAQYAALGLSALSGGLGFMGSKKAERKAKQAAERQAMIQQKQSELQKENIAAAKEEAKHKAGTDLHDTSIAFLKQRASVIAGSGEAGVAGGSVTRTLVDRTHQERDVRGRHMYALKVFNAQAERDLKGADLGLAASTERYEGISNSSLALAAGLNFASDFLRIGTDANGNWKGF